MSNENGQIQSRLGADGKMEFVGCSVNVEKKGKTRKVKFDTLASFKEHLEYEIAEKNKQLSELINQYTNVVRAFDEPAFSRVMTKFGKAKLSQTDAVCDLKMVITDEGRIEFRSADITLPTITGLGGEGNESLEGFLHSLKEHFGHKVALRFGTLFANNPTVEELAERFEQNTRPSSNYYAGGSALRISADTEALEELDPVYAARRKAQKEKAKTGGIIKRQDVRLPDEDVNVEASVMSYYGEVPTKQVFRETPDESTWISAASTAVGMAVGSAITHQVEPVSCSAGCPIST